MKGLLSQIVFFMESWQTKHEKHGLFALKLLQVLEIAQICCSVVLLLYQIKWFHGGGSGAEWSEQVSAAVVIINLHHMLCFLPVVTGLGDVVGAASRYFADCWVHMSDLGSQSWTSDLSFVWIFSCIPVVADCCLWLRLSISSSYAKGQQFSWSFSRQHLRCNNVLFLSNFVRGWLLTCLFRITVAPCAPFPGGSQTFYRNGNLHTALPVVSRCSYNFVFVQIRMKLVIKQLHSNISLSWLMLFYFILFCSFPLLLLK